MYGMVKAFKDFQMHFEVLEMWSDAVQFQHMHCKKEFGSKMQ